MAEVQKDVAAVVDGLKPLGQWFLMLSLVTALTLWAYSGVLADKWPAPVLDIVKLWYYAAAFTPVYIALARVVAFVLQRGASNSASNTESELKPTPEEAQKSLPFRELEPLSPTPATAAAPAPDATGAARSDN